jgi:hypothetical protein
MKGTELRSTWEVPARSQRIIEEVAGQPVRPGAPSAAVMASVDATVPASPAGSVVAASDGAHTPRSGAGDADELGDVVGHRESRG